LLFDAPLPGGLIDVAGTNTKRIRPPVCASKRTPAAYFQRAPACPARSGHTWPKVRTICLEDGLGMGGRLLRGSLEKGRTRTRTATRHLGTYRWTSPSALCRTIGKPESERAAREDDGAGREEAGNVSRFLERWSRFRTCRFLRSAECQHSARRVCHLIA
jgi:hypothetical protein